MPIASEPSAHSLSSPMPTPPLLAGNLKNQHCVHLEYELRQILDELDKFQRKVEQSDETATISSNPADVLKTNIESSLSQDLERLLSRLDVFQQKLEDADETEMRSLQGLLSELHYKMNVGEEKASTSSRTSKRARRRKSAERQLELYRRAKARAGWNSFDSPQGIILQNVVQRKQQQSKSWLTTIFGGGDESSKIINDDPSNGEMEEMLHQQMAEDKVEVQKALRRSNQGLKETVVQLENKIKSLEDRHRDEIATYQEVVMRLQQENIQLHLKVEDLERGGRPSSSYYDGSIYPEKESSSFSSSPASSSPLSLSPSLQHTMSALNEMEKNRSTTRTRSPPPASIVKSLKN